MTGAPSSSGRTSAFEADSLGSNPSGASSPERAGALSGKIERVARGIASVENRNCDYWSDFSPNEQLIFRAMAVAAIDAMPASGMEAGTVGTEGLDPKDDSPTAATSGGDAKPIAGRTT